MPTEIVLIAATFLCSLTAGFLFAFAVVVFPGLGKLSDRDYLRAFQVTDGIIQDNDPLFLVVWVGSVVALVAATVVTWGSLVGVDRALMLGALGAYLLGVQLPTVTINIPINNRIQAIELDEAAAGELSDARALFEDRWMPWNTVRTILACLTVIALMVLLARL